MVTTRLGVIAQMAFALREVANANILGVREVARIRFCTSGSNADEGGCDGIPILRTSFMDIPIPKPSCPH